MIVFADESQGYADHRELFACFFVAVVDALVLAEFGATGFQRRTVGDWHGACEDVEFSVFALQHVSVSHAGDRDLVGQSVEERHQLLRRVHALLVVGAVQQCGAPRYARVQPDGAVWCG